jgi:MFS family permease
MTSIDTKPVGLPLRQVIAVSAGNALSFYDFVCYAFFAAQIGATFFPAHDKTTSLLASLATFGVGFFTRPLGAFFIGRMGDRLGRKPAMVLSFALMGIGILGLALTPSYKSIGMAAPVLFILFRLVQGFALGGEVGPTTAYLIEAAPPLRRGLYVALAYATQDFGVLCAGVLGTVLASVMSSQGLTDWGWRIAFLAGAAIIPFGVMARRSLPETLEETSAEPPISFRPFLPVAVLGLMMLLAGTICNYTADYLTTYANVTLHMNATVAFGTTAVVGLFSMAADLLGGLISDKYGRKPLMLFGFGSLLLVAYPAFLAISYFRTLAVLYAATALITVLFNFATSPALTAVTESLPRRIRSGALAMIYAIAISIFGGTTQFVITWIIAKTGSPLAPAWYLMAALVIGLTAAIMMRETAPAKTGVMESL